MDCYVLAGGQSRRFGQDKTLFEIGGVPCIQRIVSEAKKVCKRVFVVAKDVEKYRFLEGVELLEDVLKEQLALVGLYTALSHTKQERIVILSADMPLIKADLISLIWEKYKGNITLYEIKGKTYPLFGVYPKRIQKELERYLKEGNTRVMDFVRALGYDPVREEKVACIDPSLNSFINMNTKEDARVILEIYERSKAKHSGNDL